MHEAYWNGLFDTRWEDAPLGPEAIRLVRKLRDWGYSERTRLGRVLDTDEEAEARILNEAIVENFVCHHLPVCRCYRQPPGRTSSSGSKTYELQEIM
jgi:hypothetical protein